MQKATKYKLNPKLQADLKKLRRGQITEKDKVWHTYSWGELSYALRRGSDAMTIHVVSHLLRQFVQNRGLEACREEVKMKLKVQEMIEASCGEITRELWRRGRLRLERVRWG